MNARRAASKFRHEDWPQVKCRDARVSCELSRPHIPSFPASQTLEKQQTGNVKSYSHRTIVLVDPMLVPGGPLILFPIFDRDIRRSHETEIDRAELRATGKLPPAQLDFESLRR